MRRRTFACARSQRRDRLRDYVFVERLERGFQGDLEHLVHRFHEMQLHGIAQVLRDLGYVFLVVFGQDDFEESGAVRRQQLLFQAADGQHFAAQGDFACHG